jgi:hypothetical protein
MASVETANVEMFHHEKERRRGDGTDLRCLAHGGYLLLDGSLKCFLQTLHNFVVSKMRRRSRVTAEQDVYEGCRRTERGEVSRLYKQACDVGANLCDSGQQVVPAKRSRVMAKRWRSDNSTGK